MNDLTHSTTPMSSYWKVAGVTAAASLLFPRLNGMIYDHERLWELDPEARVLAPLAVLLCLAVFALLGRPLWRKPGTAPATAALATGCVATLGLVMWWFDLPIIFGGLAITLGIEGLRRKPATRGRRAAMAGVVLGAVAALADMGLWLTLQ